MLCHVTEPRANHAYGRHILAGWRKKSPAIQDVSVLNREAEFSFHSPYSGICRTRFAITFI